MRRVLWAVVFVCFGTLVLLAIDALRVIRREVRSPMPGDDDYTPQSRRAEDAKSEGPRP